MNEQLRMLSLDGDRLGLLRLAVAHEIARSKQDRRYWADREGGAGVAEKCAQDIAALEALARDLI